MRGPVAVDGLARNTAPQDYWRRLDAERRAAAPWHAQAAE